MRVDTDTGQQSQWQPSPRRDMRIAVHARPPGRRRDRRGMFIAGAFLCLLIVFVVPRILVAISTNAP